MLHSRVIVITIELIVINNCPRLISAILDSLGNNLDEGADPTAILLIQLVNQVVEFLVHRHNLRALLLVEGVDEGNSDKCIQEVDVGQIVVIKRPSIVNSCDDALCVELHL